MGNFQLTEINDKLNSTYVNKKDNVVYRFAKRLFDIIFSSVLLIIVLPLLLVLALLILLIDKQTPIYVSERIGYKGRPFKIYKFRSMKADARPLEEVLSENEYNEFVKNYKIEKDPRITKLGSIIRKTSIDELPQLVNILKGDMTLVGPRPVLQEETELYGEERDLLLSVRPGLTGLWQASGRNNLDYESGKRQAVELFYVRNRGALFDIKILFMTIKAAITMNGAM